EESLMDWAVRGGVCFYRPRKNPFVVPAKAGTQRENRDPDCPPAFAGATKIPASLFNPPSGRLHHRAELGDLAQRRLLELLGRHDDRIGADLLVHLLDL